MLTRDDSIFNEVQISNIGQKVKMALEVDLEKGRFSLIQIGTLETFPN